jgi:hypothetical protein
MFRLASAIINLTGSAFRALLLLLLILSNLTTISAPTQAFKMEKAAVPDKRLESEEKFESDDKLQAEADALLFLFDNMPPVRVHLKNEAMNKSAATNTERGAAYTFCYEQENPVIFVKQIFYKTANRKQLVNLLKHELTHAWLCRQRRMSGHDAEFRRKFTAVGGFGN